MSAKIFDSHAHYNDEAFADDYRQLLESFDEKGIGHVMNISYNMESSFSTVALTKEFDFVYGAVGVHPENASEVEGTDYLDTLRSLTREPKVQAIGEIGLDYFYGADEKELQKKIFAEQMELARELDLPVVIHSRDATADTLEILNRFPDVHGVMHCFSYSAETAKELLKKGWYIGFTGAITFKNNKKGPAAAAEVPLDRLLVETDCPYMAPVPLRGKRCDSTMLPYTVAKLAEIKGVSAEELTEATAKNAMTLFRIHED